MKTFQISTDGGTNWLEVVCEEEEIFTTTYLGLIDGWHEFEGFDKIYKFKLGDNTSFEVGKEYKMRLP